LASLTAMRSALLAQRTLIQEKINDVQMLQAEVREMRAALLMRFDQATGRFRSQVPDSKWTRALPLTPSPGAGLSLFLDAMNDVAHLWLRFNADESGFELPGDCTQVVFATMITSLNAKAQALTNAETAVSLARDDRNKMQDEIRAVLRDYRQAVPSYFMPDAPLIASLPRLTPLKGKTPEPVAAEGEWVVATSEGKIVWSESEEPTLKQYQVRWSPGTEAADYSTEDEEVLGTVVPPAAREFLTTKGLLLPGGVSLFRVYVVLDTDNEKGSGTVVITRPE